MKRCLILILLLCSIIQAAIDAGPGATDRASTHASTYTVIDMANRANGTGTLDTVEIWAATDLTGVKVGTFYRTTGNTFQCRSSALIGNVTSGSKQTFNSLSISVTEGDFLGIYWATGTLERSTNALQGIMYVKGEYADASDSALYALSGVDDHAVSIYATGTGTEVFTFGKTTRGLSGELSANSLRGTYGTPLTNGLALRISVYTNIGFTTDEKIRCALYDAADNSYVAETQEVQSNLLTQGWVDCNFSPPVNVYSAKNYFVSFWGDSAFNVTHVAAGGVPFASDSTGTYPIWPNPVATNTGYQFGAYVTYTSAPPTAGGQVIMVEMQ